MTLEDVPNREALAEILKGPGAPPRITLDIGGSELEGEGTITLGLDAEGNLVELGRTESLMFNPDGTVATGAE